MIDFNLLTDDDLQLLEKRQVQLPLGYQQIKRYLPHRYPFILVDRVTACRPDDFITGVKNVTINEPFFTGHFPDNPVMPGVLMVEAMAQISGILGFISAGQTAEDGYLYLFAGVDKVRFKRLVVPGDQLILRSKSIMNKRDIYKFSCCVYVKDKLAASADIMIARQVVDNLF